MPPLYYLHPLTKVPSYRITAELALKLLGYGRDARTDEQLAADFLDGVGLLSGLPNDPALWQQTHQSDARAAHQIFRPEVQRLAVGHCLNGQYPWLAATPGEFIWTPEGSGQVYYWCPFSQQLPREPSSMQEIRLVFNAAVTGWTRPVMDYLVWTPSGSILKSYRPDTVLLHESGLTARQLWEDLIFPRVQAFYQDFVAPQLVTRGISLEVPDVAYLPITQADLTPEQLITALATQ